jgi:hypothetical protein
VGVCQEIDMFISKSDNQLLIAIREQEVGCKIAGRAGVMWCDVMSGWDGYKTDLTIKLMRTTGDARKEKKEKATEKQEH